jgi:20S proteasome subunit alpha 5
MIEVSTPFPQRAESFKSNTPLKLSKDYLSLTQLGSSAVGIKVEEGVVLAVERRLNSTLIVPSSIEKIFEVDWHIAVAASGVITDAKTLVEQARVEALNHRFTYLEPITVKALTQSVSDLALNFGEGDPSSKKKPMSRPYGVALLIAGVDERGPCIYQTDPSGTMIEYQAKGIGAAD